MDPVIFLVAVMLGTIVLSPIHGADSRPDRRRPDRLPERRTSSRGAGSLRPEDWDPSEFQR
jgi:hypothetical protein